MGQRCCMILTTTNQKETVDKIIKGVLESNLASCLQVDEVVSYFKWEGKISSELEYRIAIKAKSDNYSKIETAISIVHNYNLPQIIKFDIQDGLLAYLNWITQDI